VQHFLSVNGLDAADALAAQELYSLAFAIGVCLRYDYYHCHSMHTHRHTRTCTPA
jgi:hypothetical protein